MDRERRKILFFRILGIFVFWSFFGEFVVIYFFEFRFEVGVIYLVFLKLGFLR